MNFFCEPLKIKERTDFFLFKAKHNHELYIAREWNEWPETRIINNVWFELSFHNSMSHVYLEPDCFLAFTNENKWNGYMPQR